jgi:hypothetical protein
MRRQCTLLNRHDRTGSDTDWVEELGAFDDREE